MEAKKALVRKNFDGSAEFARTVITNIVYFVSGVLVSKGAMLGNLSPFGASFAAAVPKKYLLSALAGTGLGYILLTPSDSFRYIAVVVAIGGIRWLTSDIKRVKNSALFAPLVAFLPILATGIVLTFVSTSTLSSITDCIACRYGGLFFQQYGKAFNRKTQYCRIFPTGNRKSCAYRLCFNAIVRQCCH